MGHTLPEDNLGRVADKWIDAIGETSNSGWGVFDGRKPSVIMDIGGNPESQKKWFTKLINSRKDLLLAVQAEYGKRAKYKLRFDYVSGGDGSMHVLCDDNQYRPTFDSKMLVLYSARIMRKGVSHPPEIEAKTPALFTRHAVIRAIQRAGVHKVEDLVYFLRHIWVRVLLMYPLAYQGEQTWVIPVRIPTKENPIAIAVTPGQDFQDLKPHLVIKTVLPDDVFNRSKHIAELDDYLERNKKAPTLFSADLEETTMRLVNNCKTSDGY